MTIGLLTHHAYMSGTEKADNTTEAIEGREQTPPEEPMESDNSATSSTVESNSSEGAVTSTPTGEEDDERSKDARQETVEVTISTMASTDDIEEEGDPQHRTFTEIGQGILTTLGVN